ncbi:MAG: hypothetical protein Q7S92_03335 [Candidatus Diapherotrites archaeon]|nr:hypothetical protein [Candidatus Diapherotrites archaeon]
MKKICASCGVVFEVKTDPSFCSEKCKSNFPKSSLIGRNAIRGKSY